MNLYFTGAVGSSFFANSVDFIYDYDMDSTIWAIFLLVSSGFIKDLSDSFLWLTNIFVHDLGSIYHTDRKLGKVGHLSRQSSFACSWRAVKQKSFDVFNSQSIDQFDWEKISYIEKHFFDKLKVFILTSNLLLHFS